MGENVKLEISFAILSRCVHTRGVWCLTKSFDVGGLHLRLCNFLHGATSQNLTAQSCQPYRHPLVGNGR